MDADRFDALARSLTTGSRRAVVAAVGAAVAPLLGVADADAHDPLKKCKKKSGKQKKACIKKAKAHNARHAANVPPPVTPVPPAGCPVGTKPCDDLCIPANQCCTKADCPPIDTFRCCNGLCTDAKRGTGFTCSANAECCSDYCRAEDDEVKTCSATCRGKPCNPSIGCCRGQTCLNVGSNGQGSCGGCKESGSSCETDAECCFSACAAAPGSSDKRCGSYAGGPCEKNFDCNSCRLGGACRSFSLLDEVCYEGRCLCSYECCSHSDCDPGENCVRNANGLNGQCKPQVIG